MGDNDKFLKRHEKLAESVRRTHKLDAPACQYMMCPSYKWCPRVGSHFRSLGGGKAKVFFIFNAPAMEDVRTRTPAVGPSGQCFRDSFLSPFIRDLESLTPSYYITYLVRSCLKDLTTSNDRTIPVKEYRNCWPHLRKAIEEHRPEVIVAMGGNVFSELVSHASNRSDIFPKRMGNEGALGGDSISDIRGQFYPLALTDDPEYKPQVMPTFGPGYVLKSPAASRFFIEDKNTLVKWFKKGRVSVNEAPERPKADKITIDHVEILKTLPEVYDFVDFLQHGLPKDSLVAFDTETIALNKRFNNKFLTWQFCWEAGRAAVIPIEHPELPLFEDPDLRSGFAERMQDFFNAPKKNIKWFLAHNAKFDLGTMWGLLRILPRAKGIVPWWDTMLAMHWLDENRKHVSTLLEGKPYSLKTLAKEFFGFKFKTSHLEARADGDLQELSWEELVEYGAADVIITHALYHEQLALADCQPDNARQQLERFMEFFYWPAARAISVMECNGIYINRPYMDHLQSDDSDVWGRMREIQEVELQNRPEVIDFRKQHTRLLGGGDSKVEYDELWEADVSDVLPPLNLNKAAQQKAFYLDYLKCEPLKFSDKTEEASIDKAFLKQYGATYTAIPLIKEKYIEYYRDQEVKNPAQLDMEYRELKKLGTTYVKSLQDYLDDRNGDCLDSRIRAGFSLSGTDTGRLSSSNPNLQNLPAGRTKAAKAIKNMFQAEPPSKRFPLGTCLIQGDGAAMEVVVGVIFSEEPELVRFLCECNEKLARAYVDDSISDDDFEYVLLSSDFHKRTASLMFGIPPEQVTKAQRQTSKAITFGLLYGKSAKSLGEENGWEYEEAEEKVALFFSAFPYLKKWLDAQKAKARDIGYVETLMGRRRRLSYLYATSSYRHEGDADRRAMNSPIQGQASDFGIVGMFLFMNYILEHNLEDRWLIQNVVHDSVLTQAPIPELDVVMPILKDCMTVRAQEYVEKNWDIILPVYPRADFEIGLTYGGLHGWDQRKKTFDTIKQKLQADAKILWAEKKEKVVVERRPPPILDLVTFERVSNGKEKEN